MTPLYCLHGFLGLPADWLPLHLESIPSIRPVYLDLFNDPQLPQVGLSEWTENLNALIAQRKERPFLMGYSMGGRLALHALLKDPGLYQGAIIISAHPGLACPQQKLQRLENHHKWAEAFENDPWDATLDLWNQQSVFLSDDVIPRKEEDYSRVALGKALRLWSLGGQEDLKEALAQVDVPILWCVGGLDTAYRQIAEGLTFRHSLSHVWIAEETGHRLPWQKNREFYKQITNFIYRGETDANRNQVVGDYQNIQRHQV